MEFKEIDKKTFDKFGLNYQYNNFWQTSLMSTFRKNNGWKDYYLGVYDNNELVAATTLTAYPLKFGLYAFESSRGLCVDYTNNELLEYFVSNLKKFINKNKGLYLRMDPYFPLIQRDINGEEVPNGYDNHYVVENLKKMGFKHFGYTKGDDNNFEPRWMFILDLENKSKDDILHEMDQKTRNQIFATERKGIVVRELATDEFDKFDKIMEHTASRRGFENRNDDFYLNQYKNLKDILTVRVAEMHTEIYLDKLNTLKNELLEELKNCEETIKDNPNNRKANKRIKAIHNDLELNENGIKQANKLKDEYGDVIVMAASFFVTYGNEIIYLYSGAYDHFLKYNPSVALQWNMISYAIDNHYKRYNFYGISGNFKENEEGFGVYNFKKGFNGYVEELIGVFELPVNKFKYNSYNLLKKITKR